MKSHVSPFISIQMERQVNVPTIWNVPPLLRIEEESNKYFKF